MDKVYQIVTNAGWITSINQRVDRHISVPVLNIPKPDYAVFAKMTNAQRMKMRTKNNKRMRAIAQFLTDNQSL